MYIRVSVTPKAKKETILQEDDKRLTISVKESAEDNRANTRVLEIIKDLYPEARQVKIVNGHRSRTKLISVDLGD